MYILKSVTSSMGVNAETAGGTAIKYLDVEGVGIKGVGANGDEDITECSANMKWEVEQKCNTNHHRGKTNTGLQQCIME